jgi:outer membrane protein assembly factor BamE (lipoprotein component of BamABCDE complex)
MMMKPRRIIMAVLLSAAAAAVASCTARRSEPRSPVPQGWVPWDRVQACLSPMTRAPMPVYYQMPVDEALEALGPPHGELKDLFILRTFDRTRNARAYYWHARDATLYLVYGRSKGLVENLIVVDDVTNMGTEVLLTREEVLSTRIKPGMGAHEVYEIMGEPDSIETWHASDGAVIDRFWYEPPGEIAAPIYIDVDRGALKVVAVSTAPQEETGPPPDPE